MIAAEVVEGGLGFRVDRAEGAPERRVRHRQLLDERVAADIHGRQRAGPDLAAEPRDERAQRDKVARFAGEITPEGFAPPDPHRVGVGEHRRGPEQGGCRLPRRRNDRLGVGAGAAAGEVARLLKRVLGGLVFEQQGVVEVEEDRADGHRASLRTASSRPDVHVARGGCCWTTSSPPGRGTAPLVLARRTPRQLTVTSARGPARLAE